MQIIDNNVHIFGLIADKIFHKPISVEYYACPICGAPMISETCLYCHQTISTMEGLVSLRYPVIPSVTIDEYWLKYYLKIFLSFLGLFVGTVVSAIFYVSFPIMFFMFLVFAIFWGIYWYKSRRQYYALLDETPRYCYIFDKHERKLFTYLELVVDTQFGKKLLWYAVNNKQGAILPIGSKIGILLKDGYCTLVE